jgi:Protein of unknown function (DUF3558)
MRKLLVKRLVAVTGLAVLSIAVAACGSSVQGQPSPGTSSSPSVQQTGSAGATSGSSGSGGGGSTSLPTGQPCSLLSSSDLTQLGVSTPPSSDQIGTASGCDVTASAGAVALAIRTNEGLSALSSTGPSTSLTIGSHQAGQQTDSATGGCLVVLGVSSTSRVDVVANTDDDAQACPTALQVAKLVEPHLPPSS